MHIFLTGPIGIGKSTIIRRALDITKLRYAGFRTSFPGDRAAPDRRLHMGDIRLPIPTDEGSVVARFSEGCPHPDPARFNELGCALIREARQSAELIVMDELGFLERDAYLFQAEILSTLDGTAPVLGVVRQGAEGWLQAVVRHPNVEVLPVSIENRDALARELIARFGN